MFTRGVSGESTVSENVLKAAFIYHFLNFIEWNDHLPNFNICIPQDRELRSAMEDSLKGKMVNQRNIVVFATSPVCHVVISDQVVPSENTLTIGPLKQGALLEFRLIDHKLKFAANVRKIKQSKIKISSQLLKLAILE